LQPGGNIHPITKHIAIPLHDIAQMDADTDVNLLGYLFAGIVSTKLLLNELGTPHGMDYRRELYQKGITNSLNHVAVILGHGLPHELVMDFQQPQHAGFVSAHLATKAHYVGEHDGVQLAGLGRSHLAVPSLVRAIILREAASVKKKKGNSSPHLSP
jgi:hypothetical protein